MSRVIAYDSKTEIPNKRMKKSSVGGTIVNITPPKKIVDINTDCLESVFEFLPFSDLIIVAEANKDLKVAAERVFVRKLKKRMIIVEDDSLFHPYIVIWDNAIQICVPLLGLKIIRLFGQHISELYLGINNNSSLRKFFFIYVNEHCRKTLKILHIRGMNPDAVDVGDHSDMFGTAKYPFENVEEFTFSSAPVGPGCEHFDHLFPRLRRLKLYNNDVLDSKYILRAFPNLDTFASHYNEYDDELTFFTDSDLDTITTLNPQLQSLELELCDLLKGTESILKHTAYRNSRIWETFNAKLKNLKSIHVTFLPNKHFEGAPILFNGVEECSIWCLPEMTVLPGDLGANPLVKPIDVFSFKCLKKITVKCGNIEMWLDFVLANPTVEEFELWLTGCRSWTKHLECFEKLREKLNKVRQNTNFFSLHQYKGVFEEVAGRNRGILEKISHIEKIPSFLETNQWFDKFSIIIPYFCYFCFNKDEVDFFCEKIPQIKNYTMKKKLSIFENELLIEFEKCESQKRFRWEKY